MASAYLRSFTDRLYVSIPVAYGTATDVSKNDLAVVENSVGFYIEDGPTTAEVAAGATRDTMLVIAAAKAVFPKVTGTAMVAGDDVYYDDVNENITTNTAFRPVGTCIRDAASGATSVWIHFKQEAAGSAY